MGGRKEEGSRALGNSGIWNGVNITPNNFLEGYGGMEALHRVIAQGCERARERHKPQVV